MSWIILLSVSDILNGETTKYQVFQCRCIPSINNKKDYMCAEDENEPLRLYILVPEARPWGLTNQPGFLVSAEPKGFSVTSLHIWDRKREKWKLLHLSRKEVFSSNSNIGIEIKINGVLDATKQILLMKWTIVFNFMQNKCMKKGEDKYLCIRNYICCNRKKITQSFILWMGNRDLDIWFTRDFSFSVLHTQRRVSSFLIPVQILIFLHLLEICEPHLSSDSHI